MNENTNLLDVSEIDQFITNYKAVYQAMTAKHDCKIGSVFGTFVLNLVCTLICATIVK